MGNLCNELFLWWRKFCSRKFKYCEFLNSDLLNLLAKGLRSMKGATSKIILFSRIIDPQISKERISACCYWKLKCSFSRLDPGRREKCWLKFFFSHFFVVPQRFYKGPKDLHKAFWGTTRKSENKIFYFDITFWNARDGKG